MPPVEKLLACIVNIQEVAAVLRLPGRRFAGPQGKTAAATTIQAYARGARDRRVRMNIQEDVEKIVPLPLACISCCCKGLACVLP